MQGTTGQLFYYYKDPYRKIPIFMSGAGNRCVLWIGGQAESFFTICYFQELAAQLEGKWCFAQMELSSGHIGYGAQNHLCEAEDVDDVIGILLRDRCMDEIALFATSTGVQVALRVLEAGRNSASITRVILHGIVAPITNPLFTPKGIAKRNEQVAELLRTGRREDAKGMEGFYDIPVTASRLSEGGFFSLQEALWQPALEGDLATCRTALEHIAVPALFMIAHDAQYKPSKEDLNKVHEATLASVSTKAADVKVQIFNDTCDELRRLLKADIPAHVAAFIGFLVRADESRKELEAEAAVRLAEINRQKRLTLNALSVSS